MIVAGRAVCTSLCAAWLAVTGAAQNQDAPVVEITSPEAGGFVSGPTPLRADIVPPTNVTSVAFSVDGKPVCTATSAPFECPWDPGPAVTEHQVRIVVTFADGTRAARTLRTKGLQYTENVDVDAVQVTVTIVDETGHYVSGVPRGAFHVFEDGQPQTVSYFAATEVPLELLVAVDISGSMAPSMPRLKKAVKDFLSAVPSKNQVTLLGFNDSIFALTRKATDLAERVRAVDRLAPWGATALYDVIIRGIDMLGHQLGRKALIVFTDGEDQGSHVTLEDVERRLQSSDVTLYMIAQGRGITVERLKRIMQQLCTPTGGRAFMTVNVEELHNTFGELLDELAHQYLIGYQANIKKRDDSWHDIKVQVDGQSGIRARQGYRLSPPKK